MSSDIKFPDAGDPFEVLELEYGAGVDEINKKFRKLALKYHPDRQRVKTEEVTRKFMLITEAKNFLIGDEYKDQRKAYESKRKAEQRRRSELEKLSGKRKSMREELLRKEREAAGIHDRRKQSSARDTQEDLKRCGRDLRNAYTEKLRKTASKEDMSRQMRMKWKRKYMKSATKDDIREILSDHGRVINVEVIGNEAFILFENPHSVEKSVKYFHNNQNIRAYFIDKDRARNYEEKEQNIEDSINDPRMRSARYETNEQRRARREEYLKRMEQGISYEGEEERREKDDPVNSEEQYLYPPPLPNLDGLTPLEFLEKCEKEIFSKILQKNSND